MKYKTGAVVLWLRGWLCAREPGLDSYHVNDIYGVPIWRSAQRDIVETKMLILPVVSLGKALCEVPPFLCGRRWCGCAVFLPRYPTLIKDMQVEHELM